MSRARVRLCSLWTLPPDVAPCLDSCWVTSATLGIDFVFPGVFSPGECPAPSWASDMLLFFDQQIISDREDARHTIGSDID